MLNKFIYWKLEKGCLVFAVVSVIYSIACFIGGLILIEDIKIAREYSLHIFLADAPENVIRTVYVVIAFLDVLSSVLLLIGIVKKNKSLLLPWMLMSPILFLLPLMEMESENFFIVLACVFVVGCVFCVIYTYYSIVSLFFKFKKEEKTNPGVQLAHVENPTHLPPYNILTG